MLLSSSRDRGVVAPSSASLRKSNGFASGGSSSDGGPCDEVGKELSPSSCPAPSSSWADRMGLDGGSGDEGGRPTDQ